MLSQLPLSLWIKLNYLLFSLRGTCCESSEGVRLPERSADLRGGPAIFRGLPGKSGKLPGNLWIALQIHSERRSGEVADELPGKFKEFWEVRGGGLTASQRHAKIVSNSRRRRHGNARVSLIINSCGVHDIRSLNGFRNWSFGDGREISHNAICVHGHASECM